MGVEETMLERVFEAQHCSQAHIFAQNDQRSARNLVVIARVPEDRAKTFKNLQSHRHLCVYACRAH
eukprot:14312515-Heterocapsa_arctica.AAC.1